MVRHETDLPNVNHRIDLMYLGNLLAENFPTKSRGLEVRPLAFTFRRSHDFAEDRTAVGDHIVTSYVPGTA